MPPHFLSFEYRMKRKFLLGAHLENEEREKLVSRKYLMISKQLLVPIQCVTVSAAFYSLSSLKSTHAPSLGVLKQRVEALHVLALSNNQYILILSLSLLSLSLSSIYIYIAS